MVVNSLRSEGEGLPEIEIGEKSNLHMPNAMGNSELIFGSIKTVR